MTNDEKKKLYAALSAPFPEEAIERTDGRITGRGYSTTGIKYQYIVDRLNTVLGPGSFRAHRTVAVKEVSTAKGRTAYEAICDLTLELGDWVNGVFVVWAEALADGGHQSFSEADARKGSFTNAFKKAAAFFGVGREAYAGTIDDDNIGDAEMSQPRHQSSDHRAPAAKVNDPARTNGRSASNTLPPSSASDGPPPGYVATPKPVTEVGGRNRLTSKQLAAIWTMARKLGFEQQPFRQEVKKQFGVQPEFLDRNSASGLIDRLNAKLLNGSAPTNGTEARHEPA